MMRVFWCIMQAASPFCIGRIMVSNCSLGNSVVRNVRKSRPVQILFKLVCGISIEQSTLSSQLSFRSNGCGHTSGRMAIFSSAVHRLDNASPGMMPGCPSFSWHAKRIRKLSTVSQCSLSSDKEDSSALFSRFMPALSVIQIFRVNLKMPMNFLIYKAEYVSMFPTDTESYRPIRMKNVYMQNVLWNNEHILNGANTYFKHDLKTYQSISICFLCILLIRGIFVDFSRYLMDGACIGLILIGKLVSGEDKN